MRTMIFPMLLIGLDLGASVVYAVALIGGVRSTGLRQQC